MFRYVQALESKHSTLDVITDFQDGQDKLDISALGIVSADFAGAFTSEIKNGNTLLKDTRTGFEVQLCGSHAPSDRIFYLNKSVTKTLRK